MKISKKTVTQKSTRGFTLIELLVVIAIIGILAAIVTANFSQSKQKARDSKRVSDLAQLQLNFELFFDRCNQYPATLDINYTCPTKSSIKVSNFISVIPTDNGNSYVYVVNDPTTPTDYVLKAVLETNSTALVDAPTAINSPGITDPGCTHPTSAPYNPPYNYCVQPR